MKKLLALSFLALSLTSCQEALSPEDEIFRGIWDNDRYTLEIFQNGYGLCDIRNRGRCEGNVRIKGDKMVFTSDNKHDTVGRKAFRIDQRPTTDSNGITYMILDGRRFDRQD